MKLEGKDFFFLMVYMEIFNILFRRNLVLALRDVSIRGDFRTTVEYLITLLETDDFQHNRIDTAWLDRLISEKSLLTTVRPNELISVCVAAVHIAHRKISEAFLDFEASLSK